MLNHFEVNCDDCETTWSGDGKIDVERKGLAGKLRLTEVDRPTSEIDALALIGPGVAEFTELGAEPVGQGQIELLSGTFYYEGLEGPVTTPHSVIVLGVLVSERWAVKLVGGFHRSQRNEAEAFITQVVQGIRPAEPASL